VSRAVESAWVPMLHVAAQLGTLADDVVFLGGAVAGLLITDDAAQPLRPTDDVDLMVRIGSLVEYHQLGEQLRRLGFQEDMRGGVMCRWIIDDITVDIMPYDGLGLRNQWFRPALECPTVIEFTRGSDCGLSRRPTFARRNWTRTVTGVTPISAAATI